MLHICISNFYIAKVTKKVGYASIRHHYFVIFDMK